MAVQFGILGPLEVRGQSGPVVLKGVKPRAVLAALLLQRNESVHAERLALALWGEEAPASAVKTVQVYVSRLRKALGDPEALVTTPAGYRLRVRPDELDSDRFARLVEDGRRALADGHAEDAADVLREALDLWRGKPLAELAFEPFAQAEIERLEEQRLAATEDRVDAELAAGRHAALVGELRQLVATHPMRERFTGQLMLALYRCGQQVEALECYRRVRAILVREVGIEPGPELRSLHQAVLTHDLTLEPTDDLTLEPPKVTADPTLHPTGALPAAPSDLIGRETDVHAISVLIAESRTRVLSLVGPGGVGKTRLAVETARRLAPNFTNGARFVSLAAVAEPGDMAAAISRQLSAPAREGESPWVAVRRYLARRHLLLVLDNFEHLVAGAALVGELLAACPQLTIAVTSREPLRLAVERLYPVRPLDVPHPDEAGPAQLEGYGAVAMFLDRARALDPGFTLDADNAPHVRDICRRLDGLPLALELAAARLNVLSAAELGARLDRALAVLGSGAIDAPERQRTLRATIDWSFDLLAVPEREVFTQLSVFASGATVTAAEQVTGASLDSLDSLIAKQLLVRDGARLRMLETVREYGCERLSELPHGDAVYERLAAWCLSFARQATPHLVTREQTRWVQRFDTELPNLLAALTWALEHKRAELALQLSGALGEYWWRTGQWKRGLPWIDAALELGRDASPSARAKALLHRAHLTGLRQDEQRYYTELRASLECFRACDDVAGIATCLGHLAEAEAWHGRFERARALSDEAMHYAQRVQDDGVIGVLLEQRAFTHSTYDDTARLARTALEHLRRVDYVHAAADLCMGVGYLAIVAHRYQEALDWLNEGLLACRVLKQPAIVFHLRNNQGLAWLFLDELNEAADAFDGALAVCRDTSAEDVVDETLFGVAAVAARRGELGHAAQLVGAARRHHTMSQAHGEVELRKRLLGELLAAPRAAYGIENWDRAEAEGAALTVYEAIDLALRHDGFTRQPPPPEGMGSETRSEVASPPVRST